MDILKAAKGVIRRRDAEQGLHSLVPGRRQIRHGQLASNERLLQTEAKNNVQRVGELIRVNPNETARDTPPKARQIFCRVDRSIPAKGGVEPWAEPAQKRIRTPGLHLDDQGLAF